MLHLLLRSRKNYQTSVTGSVDWISCAQRSQTDKFVVQEKALRFKVEMQNGLKL